MPLLPTLSRRAVVGCFSLALAGWLLAAPRPAAAQAPAWSLALTNGGTGTGATSETLATAVDAAGNVFVTGYFTGTITFGSTTVSSIGAQDLFVAKYVPSTNTWAWVSRGGGSGSDQGLGIAVAGNRVYVTGYITNSTANATGAVLDAAGTSATGDLPVRGASPISTQDLFVARYTDNGTSATPNWVQTGGGAGNDNGYGLAVSGNSVYVVGTFVNSRADANSVVFGGNGSATPGTVAVAGASTTASTDLVLARYTDNGTSGSLSWTQVGGGTGADYGYGLAVSGSSVYVAGGLNNSTADVNAVVFGGTGTTAGTTSVRGATGTASDDVVVAKYTDNGTSATLGWTQIGGGTGFDYGYGLAVSGSSVYVVGVVYNTLANASAVVFGGNGTTAGTQAQPGASSTPGTDVVLAKYTDNGATATLGWTQVAGGTRAEFGYGVAASGSSVFVTGTFANSAANDAQVTFGGGGTTPGTVALAGVASTITQDVFVARYTDQGSSAALSWARAGGGTGYDRANAVAVGSSGLYVVGQVVPAATFGSLTIGSPVSRQANLLAGFDATALPTRTAGAGLALALYPNPAFSGAATLTGATPGQAVQVLDALGRWVATATADATGTARLAGLAPGLYLVRAGSAAGRLAVE